MDGSNLIGGPRCGSCKFGVINSGPGGGMNCRRNPPTAVVLVTKKDGRPVPAADMAIFPRVGAEHWCGEFVRKVLTLNAVTEGNG